MDINGKKSVMFVLIFSKDVLDEAYQTANKYKLTFKKNLKENIILVGEKDKCLEFLKDCSEKLFDNLIKFAVFRDFI